MKRLAGRSFVRRQSPRLRVGFLLVLVMLVIAMASLAMLNFSRAMLISNETSQLSSGRLQARMCAESGAQAVRLFLAVPPSQRLAQGGTQSNSLFFARNVVPHVWPQKRANYTIISPTLDETGSYSGIRYGLQNESAKLNLNMLLQVDQLSVYGALAPASAGDTEAESESSFQPLAGEDGTEVGRNMLMALPGMTVDVADSILDWLDSDDTPREFGAESEYYTTLQPPYKPANRSVESIEQLLLVRGVTPKLLYGYDENRNGMLDSGELEKLNLGIPPGALPGQIDVASIDPNYVPPPPLGLAAYLTLHSREKNVGFDGTPRININSDDLQTLYEDLKTALGNEEWASFIVAYRMAGQGGTAPINMLANITNGVEVLGTGNNTSSGQSPRNSSPGSRGSGTNGSTNNPPNNSNAGENGDGGEPPDAQPTTQALMWNPNVLGELDLTQQPQVKFQQILSLFDATVSIGEGDQARVYLSPFSSDPNELAQTAPILLDKLTTVDAEAIPGRLNIMECPREVLMSLPGMTEELAAAILAARTTGSDDTSRRYETWLVTEGLLTMDQLRGLHPLITCGGDVYKAQIVGYMEGAAAFSRIETMIDAAGQLPEIKFFRRLDHLGRGFSIPTLGERTDATFTSSSWGQ